MDCNIINKTIVITGAARGIGFGIADNFLQNDAKIVVILDIDEDTGKDAERELNKKYGDTTDARRVVFIKCDVSKDLDVIQTKILKLYKVDVLVNAAGVLDESSPTKALMINAVSLVECSMMFWESMRTDKGGRGGTIINIGSVASFEKKGPYLVFYKTSKYAVMGFTKSLGNKLNFEQFGVRVVILCPGMTFTQMTDKQICWDEHLESFKDITKKLIWQTADDVGKAALDVYKKAESGTAWTIIGGTLNEYCG